MKLQRLQHLLKHMRMASSFSGTRDDLLLETVKGKGVVTLNRPKILNVFNLSMIRRIHQQLEEWDSDDSTSLVIIKGAGDKAFCAGGDIKVVTESGRKGDGYSVDLFREEYSLNYKMAMMKKPLIAIVNGIAMGGGVGLSVHGRYRVATERAMFAMPETAIGLFPDAGAGYVLPRMKGQLGTFLGLTGHRLKGKDTLHAGYATHYVESAKVDDLEQALLELKNPSAEKVDEIVNHYHDKILKKMSPTSLKLGLHLLQEGAKLDMAAVMTLEYRMSQGCMRGHDFYEGVRALLVDKDGNPQWNPAKVEDVTAEIVDDHCRPLDNDLYL